MGFFVLLLFGNSWQLLLNCSCFCLLAAKQLVLDAMKADLLTNRPESFTAKHPSEWIIHANIWCSELQAAMNKPCPKKNVADEHKVCSQLRWRFKNICERKKISINFFAHMSKRQNAFHTRAVVTNLNLNQKQIKNICKNFLRIATYCNLQCLKCYY